MPPPFVHEQAKDLADSISTRPCASQTDSAQGKEAYYASSMFGASGLLGRFYNDLGNNVAVWLGDLVFLELAGHALLNQAAQSEGDLGRGRCGDGRLQCLVDVGGEH